MNSLFPSASFELIPCGTADLLLEEWGHYLGKMNRPFGRQDWALVVGGDPVCVATSASTVGVSAAGYNRFEVVELARLCRSPDHGWSTRVCLRLWREIAGPLWPHWDPKAVVAYSQNDRHEGRIYRFDGWTRHSDNVGGGAGGGTWTKKRAETHKALGRKSVWKWEYPVSD